MKLFDITLDGFNSQEEIESTCEMLSYGETHSTDQRKPTFSNEFNTYHGVNVYYDYGADYYFFEDGLEDTYH